ncbi:hypothetical protein SARC_08502 [Sphaeroforma arctica JP610]|uniref:BD-FAE-like domain-containing protein n=1 Tax=Sphaeroforma arctica JP610 TaxID=667725 RepID=A0A0L0FQQ3_9EUKA|nr:hypothetical protein SARC_08502 [Sphaeroforma arctica JP610]KNC79090.1 hypothetical protein SARC_08502 [Sphaeroforma arctica JP610]|eukprot:XP_014152992.1 hypothetical protein SARC_08502 [Sphaeroforma arctica JP610]
MGETIHEVQVVTERAFLLTRLAFTLLNYMGVGWRWVTKLFQMLTFVVLLLPAFLEILFWLLRDDNVLLNVRYGPESRNSLDIYKPTEKGKALLPKEKTKNGVPVIVFLSGGAWIIGYKCWGALMGKEFSEHGVMFVTPDYRNFPQGRIVDMLEDVNVAIRWIFKNIHRYGGDPNQIFLVGQSAGAHIGALCLLTEAERERRHKLAKEERSLSRTSEPSYTGAAYQTKHSEASGVWNGYRHDFREKDDRLRWRVSKVKGYIGISGAYDLAGLANYLHTRGLYRSVLSSILAHDMSFYSPARRVLLPQFNPDLKLAINSFIPPITLFHGTADQSIPYSATTDFASALRTAGIHAHVKYYVNKSHTDPIIEDPIGGGYDKLVMDIFSIVISGGDLCRNNPCMPEKDSPKTPTRTANASFKDLSEAGSKNAMPSTLTSDHEKQNMHRMEQVIENRLQTDRPSSPCANVDPTQFGFEPTEPMLPEWVINYARAVNPF